MASQKIEDLKLLIKNDRRIWAGSIFLVIIGGVWLVTNSKGRGYVQQSPPRVVQGQQQAGNASLGGADIYKDLIATFQNQIEQADVERKQSTAKLDRLIYNTQADKAKFTGIFEQIIEQMDQTRSEMNNMRSQLENVNSQGTTVGLNTGVPEVGGDEAVPFGFEPVVEEPKYVAPQEIRAAVISPGDAVKLKLLTGVAAPVDGTPYPVVFQFDGPVLGPDGTNLDLGDARLIAAAQGSESDSRVLFRLTDLAFTHPDGRRSVVKVDGWIVGEDGVRGMKGTLVDKLGQVIATTAGVSFAAALTESLDSSNSDVTINNNGPGLTAVDGNSLNRATASAITDASNRIGQALLDRYEKLVPVVEVLSGREVAAVFARTTEIMILDDEEAEYAAVD